MAFAAAPVFQAEIPEAARTTSPWVRPGFFSGSKRGLLGPASRPRRGVLAVAASCFVELAIPAEYTRATTPKHWRRPDARAGNPPYYVSPIADVPRTEV